jgi:predicted dinucleotide-utilizing enzyme
LDGDDDHVADARVAPAGAAEHLDALNALRAGVVRDVEVGAHLDHDRVLSDRR